jgi:hypothetical protein
MKLRHYISVLVISVLLAGASACDTAPRTPEGGDGPSLVVLLAIDQLPEELLERYEDVYTGGFRRLLDEGYRFDAATHDHAITETAAGHTTLSTGVYPTRHGIVANEWYEWDDGEWRREYALEELGSPIVGHPGLAGRGPENILRPGLPDWVLARDPEAGVFSVSAKDRAAIGLAATAPGDVYWLERYVGVVATSEHYRDALPPWVEEFNRTRLPELYSDTLWSSEVPQELEGRSRPDSSRYEPSEDPTFPHVLSERADPSDSRAVNDWKWNTTPFTDHVVTAFAIQALREEQLGQRGHLDYLGLSLSAVDLVGHQYGPGSREQLDNLLRLDRELERFFDALDEQVGAGQWVLAFSSDHGVLEIPEELRDAGMDAGRLDRSQRADFMAALEGARFLGGDSQEAYKAAVLELPFVAGAYTFEEIARGEPADSFATLFHYSHSDTRIAEVEGRDGIYVRFLPQYLKWGSNTATHGSTYYYDRHVPLIFLGAGVRSGRSSNPVATVDTAPTLARLAGVDTPDDLDGRVLESVLAEGL